MSLRPLRDAPSYATEMLALMPKGPIWPRRLSGVWGQLLTAFGSEPARVDVASRKLLDELDPRTAQDMFEDWLIAYGLPDPCIAAPLSQDVQRQRLMQLVTMKGSTTVQFLTAIAYNVGYDIYIETFAPARMGMVRMGDRLNGHAFAWAMAIHAPEVAVQRMFMGLSRMGDRLSSFGNDSLECVMRRHVRATTLPNLVFAYADPQDTFGTAAEWLQPGPASGVDTALPVRAAGATYFLVGTFAAEAFGGSDAAFALIASATRVSVGAAVGGDAPRATVPIAPPMTPGGLSLISVVQTEAGGRRSIVVRVNGRQIGAATVAGGGALAGDMIAFTTAGLQHFGLKQWPLEPQEVDWLERALARQFNIALASWPVDLSQGGI